VHTTDGRSIRGVLIGEHADVFVLGAPELLRGNDPPAQMGGELLILRERVSFVQDVTNVIVETRVLPEAPAR
jgi:hypothetical protein